MSIWSKICGAKEAADQHNRKTSEQEHHQQQAESEEQPYRHVPVHAAQDALHSVPGGASEDLRERIREQHRRRSALGLNAEFSRSSYGHSPGKGKTHASRVDDATSLERAGPSGTNLAPYGGTNQSQSSLSSNSRSAIQREHLAPAIPQRLHLQVDRASSPLRLSAYPTTPALGGKSRPCM